jgi:hypothetical protein
VRRARPPGWRRPRRHLASHPSASSPSRRPRGPAPVVRSDTGAPDLRASASSFSLIRSSKSPLHDFWPANSVCS